jgi:hypothetical protein
VQVRREVFEQSSELVVTLRQWIREQLRMAAAALPRAHQEPGHSRSHFGTMVAMHEVQIQVEASTRAGASRNVTVVDVEGLRLEEHPRMHSREDLGMPPVRGRGTPVE